MRPQDIVILINIVTRQDDSWQYRDIAHDLLLSMSEVSESLMRSHMAGLVDETKKKVNRKSLFEFLEHGIHYVFPQAPGTMVTGTQTAHSHPYFKKLFKAELEYVWPDSEGKLMGLSITPLYKGAPIAAKNDQQLHVLLAAIDILRVGRVREVHVALKLLKTELGVR